MKLAVSGMTCQGCVNSVTKSLERAAPGSKVSVDLAGGSVEIAGAVEEQVARHAIERAGFTVTGRIG
ncbi:MAG TPA: heavy metal-associated domain-containing protein [Methylomirabilota bacterium]|jgi:copper chaperone|nr:heavy metal-associated domain-containing protein [Methylomirabilota bacterium]